MDLRLVMISSGIDTRIRESENSKNPAELSKGSYGIKMKSVGYKFIVERLVQKNPATSFNILMPRQGNVATT